MRSRAATLLALAAVSAGLALPATGHAADSGVSEHSVPDEKSCPEYGGGKPGDKKTLTVKEKGKTKSYTVICGRDGKWHQVAQARHAGTTAAAAPATARRR